MESLFIKRQQVWGNVLRLLHPTALVCNSVFIW